MISNEEIHKTIFPPCCLPVRPADGQCEWPLLMILTVHYIQDMRMCDICVLPCLAIKIVSVTGNQLNCHWQFISLYAARDLCPSSSAFVLPLSLCLTRPSHSARSHPCIAAYSGVQLANATRSAAAAHDKSLFIICIVIEQFPFLVPWIPPSARKLLPKWQSQQILPRSKLPAYGLVSYEARFIVGVA